MPRTCSFAHDVVPSIVGFLSLDLAEFARRWRPRGIGRNNRTTTSLSSWNSREHLRPAAALLKLAAIDQVGPGKKV